MASERSQRVLEPVHLGRGDVRAVEHEELDVALPERVEALAVHVEGLVEALRRLVVVAERGVELDARIEDRFVRPLELSHEVGGTLAAVHVVAEHQHELERKPRARLGQELGDVVLCASAGSGVADDGELHGVLFVPEHRAAGGGAGGGAAAARCSAAVVAGRAVRSDPDGCEVDAPTKQDRDDARVSAVSTGSFVLEFIGVMLRRRCDQSRGTRWRCSRLSSGCPRRGSPCDDRRTGTEGYRARRAACSRAVAAPSAAPPAADRSG